MEDHEDNRRIVRDLLTSVGYEMIEALDGEAGVRMAESARPDLILMDVQLPKLSGLDATRLLRADPRTANIPLVVVTSFALSGDDRKAMDAGASAYLAKPYSPRDLMALIHRFLPEN